MTAVPATDAAIEAYLAQFINYERLAAGQLQYGTREFDVANFRRLLAALGSPHRQYSFIHVAGTKGKGSVCALLESALRGAGVRAGLTTSPHLTTYCERIRVAGETIAPYMLGILLDETARAAPPREAEENFRTVFELLIASAFLHFARAGVEVAVIETGLGGRLDATNVFNEPPPPAHPVAVQVISAIGYDHTQILGSTIEAIAAEKAAILQPGARAVIAPQPTAWGDAVEAIVDQRARDTGQPRPVRAADVVRIEGAPLPPATLTVALDPAFLRAEGLDTFVPQTCEVHLPLAGAHQVRNLQTALAALLVASAQGGRAAGWAWLDLMNGIARTAWPGRMEVLSVSPPVVLDGAHCPLSVRALAGFWHARFPGVRPRLLCAFMRDKQVRAVLEELRAAVPVESVVCLASDFPRALPAAEAAVLATEALDVPAVPAASLAEASALLAGAPAIIACGSLVLLEPMRAALLGALAAPPGSAPIPDPPAARP